MREIKFRVWDKKLKQWDYFTLKEVIDEEGLFYDDYKNWCLYTGLKDKNNKEIYEGDILKSETLDGKIHYEPVKFYEGCFCKLTTLPHNNKKRWCSLRIHLHEDTGVLIAYEIVGNVFEHPELLRKVKHK